MTTPVENDRLLSPFVYCVEVNEKNSSRLLPSIPLHATTMMYMMRSSLDSTPFHATPRDVKSFHVIPCDPTHSLLHSMSCAYAEMARAMGGHVTSYHAVRRFVCTTRKCRNVVALGVTRRDANSCYAIHLPLCDAIRGATRHDSMGYNVIPWHTTLCPSVTLD